MSVLALPRRGRGRQSAAAEAVYREAVERFCSDILEIASRLDFAVSARGWSYYLEGQSTIDKGQIDQVEKLINECRTNGDLPLDICAVDETRSFENLERIDGTTPEAEAEAILDYVNQAHLHYCPISFWEEQHCYVQMVVEKIDLKSLFLPICRRFNVPIANAKGWSDLHIRADMMRRFAHWQANGKDCVLLYCGDFDPGGLQISDALLKNMADLSRAVGWSPDGLRIDRFGLSYSYIVDHGLVWIDNLITGSGKDLASLRHPNHKEAWVQDYIQQYGARKVEANALLADPEAGRELCRSAILRYVPDDAREAYADRLALERDKVRVEVARLMEVTS